MSFRRVFGFSKLHKRPASDLKSNLKNAQYYIFGLGNIGSKYRHTRHNAGFDIIDIILKKYPSASLFKLKGELFSCEINGKNIALIKPQTFMNSSGECVLEVVKAYKVPLNKIIVISDDVDLSVGKIRIRQRGSAGTHNGLRSIVDYLDSEDFARVRVGIGKPNGDMIEHVLGRFDEKERNDVLSGYENASDAVISIITEGVDRAQQLFN
ncbi:MAG: aminoacyl-tRNA hydrolase [Eubacteriales bacterium]